MEEKKCIRCGDEMCQRCKRLAYQKEWRKKNRKALKQADKARNAMAKRVATCPKCGRKLRIKMFSLLEVSPAGNGKHRVMKRREECKECMARRIEGWRIFHQEQERKENE